MKLEMIFIVLITISIQWFFWGERERELHPQEDNEEIFGPEIPYLGAIGAKIFVVNYVHMIWHGLLVNILASSKIQHCMKYMLTWGSTIVLWKLAK